MIIKPQGKPIRRITIEVDRNGQAQSTFENLEMIGAQMGADEVALTLYRVLVTVIQTVNVNLKTALGMKNGNKTATQENHNDL